MHLFLDLEDTLIQPVTEGWRGISFLEANIAKVMPLVRSAKAVSLFSFALWKHDFENFQTHARPLIEAKLERTLFMIPTVEMIMSFVCDKLGISEQNTDFSDICDFLGKGGAFEHFVTRLEIDNACLIDDAVMDKSMVVWKNDKPLKIMICNIGECDFG